MKSKKSPQQSFDERHKFSIDRMVISWSMYSSWKYDPEKWYRTYCLGIKSSSAELTFGSAVADSMNTANPLCAFERLNVKKDGTHDEHEFDTYLGDGKKKIHLIGSVDSSESVKKYKKGKKFKARELKTGVRPWDQERADNHGQLKFYSLCFYLQDKINPEDIEWELSWFPTKKQESGDFNHIITFIDSTKPVKFKVKVTMTQILELAADIKKTMEEMVQYVNNHQ